MANDDEVHQLQRKYGVSPSLAQILILLIERQRVTVDDIESAGFAGDARVQIHRLRKAMAEHEIDIHSSYRTGYWLADEDKDILRQAIKVAA